MDIFSLAPEFLALPQRHTDTGIPPATWRSNWPWIEPPLRGWSHLSGGHDSPIDLKPPNLTHTQQLHFAEWATFVGEVSHPPFPSDWAKWLTFNEPLFSGGWRVKESSIGTIGVWGGPSSGPIRMWITIMMSRDEPEHTIKREMQKYCKFDKPKKNRENKSLKIFLKIF